MIAGLLLEEMKNRATFHPISWIPHKTEMSMESVPAAEISAAGESIDEEKIFDAAYSEPFTLDIRMRLCVD